VGRAGIEVEVVGQLESGGFDDSEEWQDICG
jgi:hypothetical protein